MPDKDYVLIKREEGNLFGRWRWCVMPAREDPNRVTTYPQYSALKSGLCFTEDGARRKGRRELQEAQRDGLVRAGRGAYVLADSSDDELEQEFERIQRELKKRNRP